MDISTDALQLPHAIPSQLQLLAGLPPTSQPALQPEKATEQHRHKIAASVGHTPAACAVERDGQLQEHAAAGATAPGASSAQGAAAPVSAQQQALTDAETFEQALTAASKVRHCNGGLISCMARCMLPRSSLRCGVEHGRPKQEQTDRKALRGRI